MFDIIRLRKEPALGFSRFFFLDDIRPKIAEAADLADAAERFKNKRTLLMLKDHAMDEGAMRVLAQKKNVCFLIDLSRLMRARGVPRAIAISKLRSFLALCVRHNAFYAFATFAENEEQLRSASELEHIIMLFGLNRGQASFSLEMIGEYLR